MRIQVNIHGNGFHAVDESNEKREASVVGNGDTRFVASSPARLRVMRDGRRQQAPAFSCR